MDKNSDLSIQTLPGDGIICHGCESYEERYWSEGDLLLCEFCRS